MWAGNDFRFQALAEDNALLTEVRPLSKDFSAFGRMGLEVLDYWGGGKSAPTDWVAAQAMELTLGQRPNAEVLLAAARPVKVLLDELAKR